MNEAFSPDELKDMTKVTLSMGLSYDDINNIRDLLKKENVLGKTFIKLVGIVAKDTSIFNAVVAKLKKTEDVSLEESAEKLKSDVASLKKLGWKLDKVAKFLITKGDEYGVILTHETIANLYSPAQATKDAAKIAAKGVAAVKRTTPKAWKAPAWPSRPKTVKAKMDRSHAENYIVQALESEGTEMQPYEAGYEEMEDILNTAGYTTDTIARALMNLGMAPTHNPRRKAAKKTPKKREE